VGVVLDSFRAVRAGVAQVIADLPEFRKRVASIDNRAVFEIPDILAAILAANRPVRAGAAAGTEAGAALSAF
jgi:hypothetical protein